MVDEMLMEYFYSNSRDSYHYRRLVLVVQDSLKNSKNLRSMIAKCSTKNISDSMAIRHVDWLLKLEIENVDDNVFV